MKHVKKSVLLWYSPHEMYTLVTGIADYPKFLPWCERAEVIEQHDGGMTARLHLHYAGVRHAFTTRNTHVSDASVQMDLVDGPFSLLEGLWRFVPLAMPGNDAAQACRIEFELRYAFSSKALETVVSPVFDRVANTFVDSFVRRAEEIHGER
ncbi:type II toxin-antitoxin system RatA family toxin [Piscinibacter sp.]|uniref:type II toxin-antitoxin system RatA family toxin n=1 Tax=Piscinibacter sp. TaxID=1903157 RepID=UPI0039E4BAB9